MRTHLKLKTCIRALPVVAACLSVAGLSLPAAAQGIEPLGHALLISDIHLDPLADPQIVRQLISAPVTKWTAIFNSSPLKVLSKYGADTNYPLFASTLAEAASLGKLDYVVFTGDALRHGFAEAFAQAGGTADQFPAFAAKTESYVVEELQRRLKAPVFVAIGNNDTGCADYAVPPNSPLMGSLADELTVLAKSPEGKADFRLGGFYSVPHPTAANQDVIVLNSVFWSTSYKSCTPDGGDPGEAEMDWLGWKLYAARLAHRSVTMVMHIPPGFDAFSSSKGGDCHNAVAFWQDRYASRFASLMEGYSDVVQLAFAGHTHMDDFRVFTGGAPLAALRITPAVSPSFRNNPGISVLSYELRSGAASDISTYFLPLSSDTPSWSKEYQFSKAYSVPSFNAASLSTIANGMKDGGPVQLTFETNYAVSAASPIHSSNLPFYSCAQTESTLSTYTNCVCAAASNAGKE
jgi:hypothetical protein